MGQRNVKTGKLTHVYADAGNRDDRPDGFDAYGHPVPYSRRQNAYRALQEMIPDINAADAMALIDRACTHIERDEPYEAMHAISGGAPFARNPDTTPSPERSVAGVALDVTGTYRLMAHLLTG